MMDLRPARNAGVATFGLRNLFDFALHLIQARVVLLDIGHSSPPAVRRRKAVWMWILGKHDLRGSFLLNDEVRIPTSVISSFHPNSGSYI